MKKLMLLLLLGLIAMLTSCDSTHTVGDYWNAGVLPWILGIVVAFVVFVLLWSKFANKDK
jgi:flagellar motor component MotA